MTTNTHMLPRQSPSLSMLISETAYRAVVGVVRAVNRMAGRHDA